MNAPHANATAATAADGLSTCLKNQPAEEAIAHVVDCICNHPRHRELLYKALAFCDEERDESEVESYLQTQPEQAQALQTPYALVRSLVAAGGLAQTRYDAAGAVLDSTRRAELAAQGLDDDAAAALAVRRTVTTTPAGHAAVALLDPERRIAACVNAGPARRDAFVRLLEHCREPRSLDSVKQLLDEHPALEPTARSGGQRLHAVYFIDRLNEVGGLVWDGSWVTTEAGKRFLASV
ncbi:hypothetical protein [Gordonibacter massiliensis (ex Traore et al. 2017)]|uniref:hypothetical protein n=1 Tax=Gordonibacter massiliensis (ex Traore et al. 2017) TaxID=1841863 RepID=UPI001C8CD477|nr:hypothetical protein [Gordonibacter massiliensis (ex Traore et al. 2017)]MBX9032829.1 hypothetical protein [Gordonibacter massiliensis (ex Traore et al. 2017)]